MNKNKFDLTNEDIKQGIENFFIQLLVEAKMEKADAKTLADISSEHPKISYITGQPGAGKTSLNKQIKQEYEKKGECVVSISPDKIATYHKYYNELLKLLPDECYSISRKFVTPACEIILKEVRSQNLNVIRESAFNKGEIDYERAKVFKDAGYEVEVNTIIVDKYESFLSCIERDVKLLEKGYDPRPITKKNHDSMYESFLGEITEIKNRGLCDNIRVFVRGEKSPKLVYENGYNNYSCAREAIITERIKARKKITLEPKEYLRRITSAKQKIVNLIKDENMKNDYLKKIKELENEYKQEISLCKKMEI